MKPINLIDIETKWGYRSFELYHADITQFDFKIDVLAVSAFEGNYEPVPGTVVAALKTNCGIDLAELSTQREFDLADVLGCWVAKAIPDTEFERVICVEMVGRDFELKEVIENLFAVLSMLEVKGVKPQTLALPILGAGQQQQDPAEVIKELLHCSINYMHHSPHIRKILFVAKQEDRARQLDRAMNERLRRVDVALAKGEWFEHSRTRVLASIDAAGRLAGERNVALFGDAHRLLSSPQVKSFEMGFISRRLVEFVVNDLLHGKARGDLIDNIERLSEKHIADWIRSYMHVLRVFGNNSAHEKGDISRRKPTEITASDMALSLYCLQQVLDFWLDWRRTTESSRATVTLEGT